MRKAKVYALVNPIDRSVFYIGVTICKLSVRLNSHCIGFYYTLTKGKCKERTEYIKSIIGKGKRPEIVILEEVNVNIAEKKRNNIMKCLLGLGLT